MKGIIYIRTEFEVNFMSRVGSRVSEARKAKGMTQKALGKKLGVSESYINEVETGKKIASENLITRIQKVLDVDFNEEIPDTVMDAPVENIKERPVQPKNVSKQWEDAFSSLMKKIPVYDMNMKEIQDYKYLPVIEKKVEGHNPDKLMFVKVNDDTMRGFRICRNDVVMVVQNSEVVNNSMALIEEDGKKCIRQIRRLDSNKVLILSHSNELRTETRDVKSLNIIGRCLRVEIEL